MEKNTKSAPVLDPEADARLLEQSVLSATWDEPTHQAVQPQPQTTRPTTRSRVGAAPLPQAEATPKPKPRQIGLNHRGIPYRLGRTLVNVAIIAAGLFLWYTGARYTLGLLQTWTEPGDWLNKVLHVQLQGAGAWRWLIPGFITLCEIILWPRRQGIKDLIIFFWPSEDADWKHWLFVGILTFDVWTTCAGALIAETGQPLSWALFTSVSAVVLIRSACLGLMCAILPERLIRNSFKETWRMWVPKRSWMNQRAEAWGLV